MVVSLLSVIHITTLREYERVVAWTDKTLKIKISVQIRRYLFIFTIMKKILMKIPQRSKINIPNGVARGETSTYSTNKLIDTSIYILPVI